MKKIVSLILMLCILLWTVGCVSVQSKKEGAEEPMQEEMEKIQFYTTESRIEDVISDPSFGDYGCGF